MPFLRNAQRLLVTGRSSQNERSAGGRSYRGVALIEEGSPTGKVQKMLKPRSFIGRDEKGNKHEAEVR